MKNFILGILVGILIGIFILTELDRWVAPEYVEAVLNDTIPIEPGNIARDTTHLPGFSN
jgi:hypothetical protein